MLETHKIFNTHLRGETQIVILCVITSKLTTQLLRAQTLAFHTLYD